MTLSRRQQRRLSAAGIALGFVADRVLGDPRRGHPVAGFGLFATRLEASTYADRRLAGAAHVGVLVGGVTALGVVAESLTRPRPVAFLLATAGATWAVLGGRSLQREAMTIATQLGADDLAAARVQVRNLVGRETSGLTSAEVARAGLESVAENTADAVVAPLFWGAVAGIPGLIGYRAVNTLDAMIGHRSTRYENFGWAAARLDDLANWLPARMAGLITVAVAPMINGNSRATWMIMVRDSPQHPSPNAGVVEAAFAGALGVRLGGSNVYSGLVEDRGTLGDGPPADVPDLARATRLSVIVSASSAVAAIIWRALR